MSRSDAFRRFIIEYVGNLPLPEDRPDRRSNWHTRDLMDWMKGQMETSELPADKKHAMVRDFRDAFGGGSRDESS